MTRILTLDLATHPGLALLVDGRIADYGALDFEIGIPKGTPFGGDSVYSEPDPVTVARVWRTHGWTAVAERWFYKSHTELKNIRLVGEERLAALTKRNAG